MFKIFPLLVMHALCHLVAVLLLRTCDGMLPVRVVALLEYVRVVALLYYYKVAEAASWAYMGVGVVRHWEVVVQQGMGWWCWLVQYPGVAWVLLVGVVVVAVVRLWVLVWLVKLEGAGRSDTGRGGGARMGSERGR